MQRVAQQNLEELERMLPVVRSLAGAKASKEQYWVEVFKFLDQAMPADVADCSLDRLSEDLYTVMTHAEQVLPMMQPALATLSMLC